jgi:osmotically-inducible protein OsmY
MKSDMDLKRDVEDELAWEPSVDASHIAVSVRAGIATLEGHVPAYGEKCIAERAAARVLGVKAVADELEVKLLGRDERSDEEIATACVSALNAQHYGIPAVSVKALISDGFVTLEGQVDWKYQKDAAASAVRYLTGVKGVVNNIDVKPRVSAGGDQKKITAALKRNAELDTRHVVADSENGIVILRGHVRSLAAKEEAERAAWSAPGVWQVKNRIAILP